MNYMQHGLRIKKADWDGGGSGGLEGGQLA